MSRVAALPVLDHASALEPVVGRLCRFLTVAARRRVAEMAVAMREAALNDEGCQVRHLHAAGFSTVEIGLAWPLARRALERRDGPDLTEPSAFSANDVGHLRTFNARHMPNAATLLAA